MAGFRIEAGTAKGRGFGNVDGVPSFLNRLRTWIVKSFVDGGPGWFIIDDQSSHPTAPYIVCSNVAGQPTNASRSKILRFALSATADTVVVSTHLFHNITTQVSSATLQAFTLNTSENSEYGYNFRGGTDVLLLMTNVGGTWDYVKLNPWVGHSLLVGADFTATLAQDWIVETGDGGNQFSGYYLLQNLPAATLEANAGLFYAFFDNNATLNQFLLYTNPARTSEYLIAQTSMSNGIGGQGVTAQNSSGVTGSVIRNAVGSDDSDIVIDFKLYLSSGQGALFTVGETYFIWDLVNGTDRVGYFKVLSIIGDTLVVSGLNAQQPFSAGACISPYGHRWMFDGNQVTGNGGGGLIGAVIPYTSDFTAPIPNRFTGNTHVATTYMGYALWVMNPNDRGRFAVMRPWVHELQDRTGTQAGGNSPNANVNRMYGYVDYEYVSARAGMAQMTFGRVINGANYITYALDGNSAFLFLDSESLS